ncbi:MAG: adenosine-specific kinase [Methanomassiliicoccales archaeon]|nr:adenosine-specific kinase [Methanomassiliicoccales archaeon]
MKLDFHVVRVDRPVDSNVIIGQTHFIKSAEDLYEAMVNSVPGVKFGIAFNEASGDRLVRTEGNDKELIGAATRAAKDIGAGHVFVIFIRNAYPVNVLNRVKEVAEVCTIFCATANDVEVIVAETELGRGVVGVIDGQTPLGVENDEKTKERQQFLRKIGYKR